MSKNIEIGPLQKKTLFNTKRKPFPQFIRGNLLDQALHNNNKKSNKIFLENFLSKFFVNKLLNSDKKKEPLP